MPLLLGLIQHVFGIISRLAGIVLVSVCIPRVPPHNWNSKLGSTIRISKATKGISAFLLRPIMNSVATMDDSVDLHVMLSSRITDTVLLSDVTASIAIPTNQVGNVPDIRIRHPRMEDSSTTTVNTSMVDVDFSIYSDASSPNLNKAMFITPPRSSLMSANEFQLGLLKAASERVSEILRENRRRLDAGEDPNTNRKEARRRRAQELLAARNNRDSFSG